MSFRTLQAYHIASGWLASMPSVRRDPGKARLVPLPCRLRVDRHLEAVPCGRSDSPSPRGPDDELRTAARSFRHAGQKPQLRSGRVNDGRSLRTQCLGILFANAATCSGVASHRYLALPLGLTFASLRPITGDPETRRFEAIAFDPEGALFAAWLDKRKRALARAKGDAYTGASLAFAWSKDGASAHRQGRRLRVLPARPRRPRCGASGGDVPQYLRQIRARSCGDDRWPFLRPQAPSTWSVSTTGTLTSARSTADRNSFEAIGRSVFTRYDLCCTA
jgi:hypothetical protein